VVGKWLDRENGILKNIGDFIVNLTAKYVIKGIRSTTKPKLLTLQEQF